MTEALGPLGLVVLVPTALVLAIIGWVKGNSVLPIITLTLACVALAALVAGVNFAGGY